LVVFYYDYDFFIDNGVFLFYGFNATSDKSKNVIFNPQTKFSVWENDLE